VQVILKMAKSGNKTNNGIGGFSLVEFTIVLLLIALFVAGAARLYGDYQQRQMLERNANAILVMKQAIDSYFIVNRHYPCPAPLTARPGDAGYGRSLDCANTASGDYRLITRTDLDYDGDGANDTIRIREGAFPFMDVKEFMFNNNTTGRDKPGGNDTLDAYKQQYTYVMTERQATINYADQAGGIRVLDEHNRVIANNGNFLLISHGVNGAGARMQDGSIRRACSDISGTKEFENCNGDATYVHALQSHAPGANYYDDQVGFLQWIPYYLWEQTDANPKNIHNINPGSVGMGVKNPTDKLHIKDGDLLAYRFWDDGEGEVSATNICNDAGGDCFPPELIAGDIFPECGSMKVMTGIKEKEPLCENAFGSNFNSPCPANQYICRMRYVAASKSLTVRCMDPITTASCPN